MCAWGREIRLETQAKAQIIAAEILSVLKNPHFLGIIFKKAWQYKEYSQALSIRFKMRADVNKFAFLDRNLICKREQISQAMMCGRAEILTSQANLGNNHSQPQKWRGGFLCPPPATYHGSWDDRKPRDVINTVSWKGQWLNSCLTCVTVDLTIEREIPTLWIFSIVQLFSIYYWYLVIVAVHWE